MKLLRTLLPFVLIASISATGVAAATATVPASQSAGVSQPLSDPGVVAETSTTVTSSTVAASLPSTDAAPTDTGGVIVGFEGSATPSAISAVAKSADTSTGAVKQVIPGTVVWRAPKGRSTEQFARQLAKSGRVAYAVPDYIRQPTWLPSPYVVPNDPAFTDPNTGDSYYIVKGRKVYVARYPHGASWWLREINAPAAWIQGYTGFDIMGKYPLRADGTQFTVVVLDTGLYTSHPDAGNIVPGYNFFDNNSNVTPLSPYSMSKKDSLTERILTAAHGTCVSGEIAATADNSLGTVGVGYDTRVVVDKVLGKLSDGTVGIPDDVTIAAINSAVASGAKVINMSYGDYHNSQAIQTAINNAYNNGCVIVAAKGNDSSGRPYYPANNAHVISVGALDKNANKVTIPAAYSNYSKTSRDIMAPGTFIVGLASPSYDLAGIGSGYYIWDGTSMASPVVAGAIAWLWRAAPALSNAEIMAEVLNSATKGPKSKHYPAGYRKLDMAAAYARLKADYPLLTQPAMADQTVASLGSVPVTWGVPLARLRGVTYDLAVDAVSLGSTADSGRSLPLSLGDHTVGVTAHSAYNWDDGTAQNQESVHVVPSVDGTSTWLGAYVAGSSATVASPAYGGWTSIDAALQDASGTALAGATVKLQVSSDGITYSDVTTETNLPGGVYRSVVMPRSRTWYRAAFYGYGGIAESSSSPVVLIPGVSLSTPSSASSISHTKSLTVSGKLMPAHASSSRVVKLQLKRWNGHRWVDYSSVWTRVTWRSSSYSTYSAKFKLKKGAYRIYAYAVADAQHSATTSGYKAVTVK